MVCLSPQKRAHNFFSLLNLGLQLHHLHDTSFVKARECSMQMTKLTRIHTSNPVNLYGLINLQYKTNPTLPHLQFSSAFSSNYDWNAHKWTPRAGQI